MGIHKEKLESPKEPGKYNIAFERVRTMLPLFAEWNGECWVNVDRITSFTEEERGEMYWFDKE